MKLRVLVLAMLMGTGCSPERSDDSCDAEPDALGRECSGDGECGDWAVCGEDGGCETPAAVRGEGGAVLSVTRAGELVDTLRVEVARSDVARARGLGERPCIAEGWGMLLEFPAEGDHVIQTRTMRFALDLAFADEDGVVHTVYTEVVAGGATLHSGASPTKRVLESPTGAVEVAVGDVLVVDGP